MTKITRGLLFMITLFVVGSVVTPVSANAQYHHRHHRHHHHYHHR